MNHRQIEQLIFEEYSFTELDRRCDALGVTCDGAAWHGLLSEIRKQRGVLMMMTTTTIQTVNTPQAKAWRNLGEAYTKRSPHKFYY